MRLLFAIAGWFLILSMSALLGYELHLPTWFACVACWVWSDITKGSRS